ncbi:PAS domain-containing protein [Haloarcula rara]|uniref:PAS domain-containing protein n=1 Tax=Haloarcula rara TaxID=3033387 RepID=UPI0023E8B4BF|nr:PAS domain-containing protein [Halomicroarcula sp. SHR3]
MSTDSGAPASDTDAVYGALDRVDEAVCAVDTEWQFTFVNAEAGALLGRGPEELLETTIWDAVPHVGDGRVGGKLREAMRTQAPVRFESYSEERERWFRVRIYPSEDGLTAFFYDITDERGAALDRQRQRRSSRPFSKAQRTRWSSPTATGASRISIPLRPSSLDTMWPMSSGNR